MQIQIATGAKNDEEVDVSAGDGEIDTTDYRGGGVGVTVGEVGMVNGVVMEEVMEEAMEEVMEEVMEEADGVVVEEADGVVMEDVDGVVMEDGLEVAMEEDGAGVVATEMVSGG